MAYNFINRWTRLKTKLIAEAEEHHHSLLHEVFDRGHEYIHHHGELMWVIGFLMGLLFGAMGAGLLGYLFY